MTLVMVCRGRGRQVAGWFVLGIAAVAVELALLWLLYQVLLLPLWLASALAAEALILGRFVVADRWVFGHPRPTFWRLGRYHGACAGAFAVSWLLLNGAAALLGVPYLLAALVGTAGSFAWSLATNFLWVWRHPHHHATGHQLRAGERLELAPLPPVTLDESVRPLRTPRAGGVGENVVRSD